MSAEPDPKVYWEAGVKFSIEFDQTWSVFKECFAMAAQDCIEEAIEKQIKAGTISIKSLLKTGKAKLKYEIDWPKRPAGVSYSTCDYKQETVQEERMRAMNDEIVELVHVDCSGYEI